MTSPDIRINQIFSDPGSRDQLTRGILERWPTTRTLLHDNLRAIYTAASAQDQKPSGLAQFLNIAQMVILQQPKDILPGNLRIILPGESEFTNLKARLSLYLPNRQHGAANIFGMSLPIESHHDSP